MASERTTLLEYLLGRYSMYYIETHFSDALIHILNSSKYYYQTE